MSGETDGLLWGDLDAARLPKVSLHDHLDGALRPETVLELAVDAGVAVPAAEPEALATWFRTAADSGSLVDFLATFQLTAAVLQTPRALSRVAHEYVLDLAADGVLYGETRWAPEQHRAGGLSLDEAIVAVQAGLETGMAAARAEGRPIRVNQLICAMRQDVHALDAAEAAVRHRDRGVVGFDIAGPEDGFPPALHRVAFDYLADQCLPVTVHAGEAVGLASIRGALLDGRALRIGHGVRIAEDLQVDREDDDTLTVTVGRLARWIRDRQIALELCPTSNLMTGAIAAWGTSLADHPFDLLYRLGFRVTVNTDDRLQCGTTLSEELVQLTEAFEYDLDDLLTFQLNAVDASFLPLEDRERLADLVQAGFEAA